MWSTVFRILERVVMWLPHRIARPKRQRSAQLLEDHLLEGQRLERNNYLTAAEWFEAAGEWHQTSLDLLQGCVPANEVMMYKTVAPDFEEPLNTEQAMDAHLQLTTAASDHKVRVAKLRAILDRYIRAT